MLVGLDDTDSPAGGCTTHFALQVAVAFQREHGLVLRQLPRLVRLNPNVPWKTRGNAAVCLAFGVGDAGEPVGQGPGGEPVFVDRQAPPAVPGEGHVEALRALVGEWCDLEARGTDPAAVLVPGPLPEPLYREAVTGVVEPERTRQLLGQTPGARWFALGDGRGIVGAAAAAAWPARETTYEFIAYRERARWGSRRTVGAATVDVMEARYPETFHNFDRDNGHLALAPSTPCPVLIGVRAFSPDRLPQAACAVDAGEPWAGHMLFVTNQATDDHVVDRRLAQVAPLETVRAEGTVVSRPRRVEGGHVIFPLADEDRVLDCAAYEPTKGFRGVVERLEAGDRVRVVGALRADGRSLNLEKIEVLTTVARPRGAAHTSRGPADPPAPGWYEVPVAARRHLARPLDPHGGRFSR